MFRMSLTDWAEPDRGVVPNPETLVQLDPTLPGQKIGPTPDYDLTHPELAHQRRLKRFPIGWKLSTRIIKSAFLMYLADIWGQCWTSTRGRVDEISLANHIQNLLVAFVLGHPGVDLLRVVLNHLLDKPCKIIVNKHLLNQKIFQKRLSTPKTPILTKKSHRMFS